MGNEWQTSVLVPIFKRKGDIKNCNTYRGAKLLEHAMKIVQRVLKRRIRELVNIDSMQFGLTPGRRNDRRVVRRAKNAKETQG